MVLTKEQILKAEDLDKEEVDVKEWGGSVYVRAMTGKERDAFEASLFETKGDSTKQNFTNMRAKLVAKTVVDEAGTRLFSDGEIELVGAKSARVLDRIFKVAQRLNGIGQEAVEELTKN